MNLLHEYINGNYTVKLYEDGTKERIYDTEPSPVFPESMDVKVTDYCDAGCPFCFHPDSTVTTIDGNMKISDIKTGDIVYSFNEITKKVETSLVENVITKNVDEELIVIDLENGKTIKCTSDHEIFTKNRGWVKASELSSEDELSNIF